MVQYETLYGTDNYDFTLHEKNTISLGGTTTIRLTNGKSITLVEAAINYNTKNIYGKDLAEVNLGYETYQVKSILISLTDIAEVITEGFIITQMNRKTILKVMKEVKFTKIPQKH